MARAQKLKVYRTPIGFHDAYVAAPSQKAALRAWGADADLFARGSADLVTDEALTAAPLAQPGVVVKRLRGSAAEHLAALPEDAERSRRNPRPEQDQANASPPRGMRSRTPRPDRSALHAAEQALNDARDLLETQAETLRQREVELSRRRLALDARRTEVLSPLEQAVDDASKRYQAAMLKWRS